MSKVKIKEITCIEDYQIEVNMQNLNRNLINRNQQNFEEILNQIEPNRFELITKFILNKSPIIILDNKTNIIFEVTPLNFINSKKEILAYLDSKIIEIAFT